MHLHQRVGALARLDRGLPEPAELFENARLELEIFDKFLERRSGTSLFEHARDDDDCCSEVRARFPLSRKAESARAFIKASWSQPGRRWQ
ncbi:hypothetical protein [Steroidobacter cummioxidans]|uniref:hypothetical protein n=1 Tax=Steroidobacter cummioxidans TaxID=1803913 RepID=UPI00137A19FF|nr:hypothetical protein [Steroidobacter cummioxidans]